MDYIFWGFLFALLTLSIFAPALPKAIKTYWHLRESEALLCPEIKKLVEVKMNALGATSRILLGKEDNIRVKDCARWPERAECTQDCLSRIRNNLLNTRTFDSRLTL